MESGKVYLVCGTIPAANAEPGTCSMCGATVWPTIGSLRATEAHQIVPVCLDCFAKQNKYEFAGVMHHGYMMPTPFANRVLLAVEELLRRRKQEQP